MFDKENGICKSKDDAWNTETINAEQQHVTFTQWLGEELSKPNINSCGYVISLLARAGAETVKAHKGGRDDT